MRTIGLCYAQADRMIGVLKSKVQFMVEILPVVDLDKSLDILIMQDTKVDQLIVTPHMFSGNTKDEISERLKKVYSFVQMTNTNIIFLDEEDSSRNLYEAVMSIFGGDMHLSYKIYKKITASSILSVITEIGDKRVIDVPKAGRVQAKNQDSLLNALSQGQTTPKSSLQRRAIKVESASENLGTKSDVKEENTEADIEGSVDTGEKQDTPNPFLRVKKSAIKIPEFHSKKKERNENTVGSAEKQSEGTTEEKRSLRKEKGILREISTSFFGNENFDNSRFTIFITGGPRSGKSTAAKILAETFGKMGKITVLVDTNTQKPLLSATFSDMHIKGTQGRTGFIDASNMEAEVKDCIIPVDKYLDFLGTTPEPNEIESQKIIEFNSNRLVSLLPSLSVNYEIVIVDISPELIKQNYDLLVWVKWVLWVVPNSLGSMQDAEWDLRFGNDKRWNMFTQRVSVVLNNCYVDDSSELNKVLMQAEPLSYRDKIAGVLPHIDKYDRVFWRDAIGIDFRECVCSIIRNI